MADGREVEVWDAHADDCEAEKRKPKEFVVTPVEGAERRLPNKKNTWLRETLESLEDVTDILDIGCGACYWVNLFEGYRYHGFDQSRRMLEVGYGVLKDNDLLGSMVELRNGNARSLLESFPEKKFDLIFTAAVLQHNRHEPDKAEIVQGMHSILREGGYYLCTENTFREDNAPQFYQSDGPCDGNSFSVEGWKKFMLEYGFEMVEFYHPSEYLYRRV